MKELIKLNIWNIVSCLMGLSINIIYLSYIHHLEKSKCECSLDWKHEFIKYAIIINTIFAFSSVAFPNLLNGYFLALYGVFNIIYILILGDWLWTMHKSKCKCSEDWRKTFMETLYIILVVLICICSMYTLATLKVKNVLKK